MEGVVTRMDLDRSSDTLVQRRGDALRERIASVTAVRAVTIVAVTKGHGSEVVRAARSAGFDDLGESRAEELLAKTKEEIGPTPRWHYLGAIQRRKVKALASFVSLWQSVDREAAGCEIARYAPGAAVLVQVNVTGDPGRSGCSWGSVPSLVEALRRQGLDVRGLMAVPDRNEPGPQCERLARLASGLELTELSMGMSNDFEQALDHGSTMIRVGRALFGPRPIPDHERRQR